MSDEFDPDPREAELDEVGLLMQACLTCQDDQQLFELERACAAHPSLATELRRRFAFLQDVGLDARAADEAPLPARFGDFEPLERLAAGGMGVVYRARQVSLDRVVALKLVRPELLFFDGARERFRREASSIARLDHPGIVPVYAAGEVSGVPFLAMQLVDGCTLAEALTTCAARAPESLRGSDLIAAVRWKHVSDATLPAGFDADWVTAIATVVRDVARALAHAHARGVVHRDVKPSNVLLGADGRAQLIDFGLTGSEAADSLTRTGSQVGTVHYMSPERLRGERGIDVRSDIYSTGVTLYELLALQTPFQAGSRAQLERLVQDGHVDPLRVRNRRVDADLERVCLKAMALEPTQRYQDATALADDLALWLSGEPVRARRPAAFERAASWIRRRKSLTAALALALLLLIGVPTLLYALQRRHSNELARSLDSERAALADMRVANEIITKVLRDASPAHSDGRQVTLFESLEKMAALADDGQDAPRARAQVLSMIGQIHLSHSDYDSAERLLLRADQLLQDSGFAAGKERVLALEKLGLVHKARGELEQARECYRSASAVALEAGLSADEWPPRMLALEAATFFDSDRARAAELLREALRAFQASPGNADDRDWLKTNRLRLAQLEGSLGNPAAGLRLLDEVRADIARQSAASPRDRLELAAAESVLATAAKDFARAEQVLREALDISREVTGEKSSTTSTLLFQLGRALFEQGDRDQAMVNMEQALAIRRDLTGVDSPAARQWADEIERIFKQ